MPHDINWVYQLSDEELRAQLLHQGLDVGPVLQTTRKLYQKKLIQYMTGNVPELTTHYEPVDEDDEAQYLAKYERRTQGTITDHGTNDYIRPSSSYSVSTPPRRRPLHQTETRSYSSPAVAASKTNPQAGKSSHLPTLVKLVVFLVVLVIAYLVYINLETEPTNRIPGKVELEV